MSDPGERETLATDRRRRVGVGVAVAAVGLVAAALLVIPGLRDGEAGPVSPAPVAATPSSTATTATSTAPPVVTPTAPASPATPAALPPLEQRWRGESPITSDTPLAGDELQDGAFVAIVRAIDAQARTITADVVIFYGGDDAFAAAEAREPENLAQVVNNNMYVVNDVERERVLGVTPDLRAGVWCFDDGSLRTVELAFDQWAAPSELGQTTACGVRGRPLPSLYWLDVRSGLVAQVTEQYTP